MHLYALVQYSSKCSVCVCVRLGQASLTSLTHHSPSLNSFTLIDSAVWHPGYLGGCTHTLASYLEVVLDKLVATACFICMHFPCMYVHVFVCILHVNNITFHHTVTSGLDSVSSKSTFGPRGLLVELRCTSACVLSCFYVEKGSSRVMHHERSLNYSITQNCHSLKPAESWVFFWSNERHRTIHFWWLFKDISSIFKSWGLSEHGWSLLVVATQRSLDFFFLNFNFKSVGSVHKLCTETHMFTLNTSCEGTDACAWDRD